jgi:pimeloyl-ACP methyl ester carboxylesterase
MGRSYPSFAHEECSLDTYQTEESSSSIVDFSKVESIIASLQPRKDRVWGCWSCSACGFQMNETQSDGTVRTFHFLEYSGTRELAEDIERIRLLLNAPKLNVYGISYGTLVFGTYATMFPASVGLFILDSPTSPDPYLPEVARAKAIGEAERIDYLIYSCSARNILNPGSCPVSDMRQCIGDAGKALVDNGYQEFTPGFPVYTTLGLMVQALYKDLSRAEMLCSLAKVGDVESLIALIGEINGGSDTRSKRQVVQSPSQPTFRSTVYDNPDYAILMKNGEIAQSFVRAQDSSGASYDEDFFAQEVAEFNAKYKGARVGLPADAFAYRWGHSFYWPKSVPLPPLGSPDVRGIVAGSLYDPATPYRWTQQMRAAFPNMNLLTSQSITHIIATILDDEEVGRYDCQQHILDYLTNGYVGFQDGSICEAEFASKEALFEQLSITL